MVSPGCFFAASSSDRDISLTSSGVSLVLLLLLNAMLALKNILSPPASPAPVLLPLLLLPLVLLLLLPLRVDSPPPLVLLLLLPLLLLLLLPLDAVA